MVPSDASTGGVAKTLKYMRENNDKEQGGSAVKKGGEAGRGNEDGGTTTTPAKYGEECNVNIEEILRSGTTVIEHAKLEVVRNGMHGAEVRGYENIPLSWCRRCDGFRFTRYNTRECAEMNTCFYKLDLYTRTLMAQSQYVWLCSECRTPVGSSVRVAIDGGPRTCMSPDCDASWLRKNAGGCAVCGAVCDDLVGMVSGYANVDSPCLLDAVVVRRYRICSDKCRRSLGSVIFDTLSSRDEHQCSDPKHRSTLLALYGRSKLDREEIRLRLDGPASRCPYCNGTTRGFLTPNPTVTTRVYGQGRGGGRQRRDWIPTQRLCVGTSETIVDCLELTW